MTEAFRKKNVFKFKKFGVNFLGSRFRLDTVAISQKPQKMDKSFIYQNIENRKKSKLKIKPHED